MLLFVVFSRSQSVEERCEYQINPENSSWTEIKREAWISSNVYGLTRAVQVSRVKRSATVHNSESGVWRLRGRLAHLICHSVIGNIIRSVKMRQLNS